MKNDSEFEVSEIKFEKNVPKTVLLKFKESKRNDKSLLDDIINVFKNMPNYDKEIHKLCFVFLDRVDIIETDKEIIIKEKVSK